MPILTAATEKRIAVITDGACDITGTEAAQRGFSVIPIPMVFPDGSASDSDGFPVRDFWQALLADYTSMPKTSKPNVFTYERKLQELADAGYEAAFILTMSTGLSSTYESAIAAAETAPIPTRVMDSRTVTWGMVLLCDAAVRGVESGLTLDELAEYVQTVRDSMGIYFVVDTLEYLVRGGRAGRAAGLLATALDIKPILTIEADGIIEPAKKCRGRKKAYQKLAGIVAERTAGVEDLHYIMLFTNDRSDTEELRAELETAGLDATYDGMKQVGITVGIYAGPGTSATIYWQDIDPETFRA